MNKGVLKINNLSKCAECHFNFELTDSLCNKIQCLNGIDDFLKKSKYSGTIKKGEFFDWKTITLNLSYHINAMIVTS